MSYKVTHILNEISKFLSFASLFRIWKKTKAGKLKLCIPSIGGSLHNLRTLVKGEGISSWRGSAVPPMQASKKEIKKTTPW